MFASPASTNKMIDSPGFTPILTTNASDVTINPICDLIRTVFNPRMDRIQELLLTSNLVPMESPNYQLISKIKIPIDINSGLFIEILLPSEAMVSNMEELMIRMKKHLNTALDQSIQNTRNNDSRESAQTIRTLQRELDDARRQLSLIEANKWDEEKSKVQLGQLQSKFQVSKY